MSGRNPDQTTALTRLALGAAIGLLCAGMVLLYGTGSSGVDPGAVAYVNGSRLEMTKYLRALRLFASEKRTPINEGDRALILERMIEEELLLQFGVDIGLLRDDPSVRVEMLRAVLTGLTEELQARDDLGGTRSVTDVDPLTEHLAQLRSAASIRWTDSVAAR